MDVAEVIARIKQTLPDAEIKVEGKDCDFSLTLINASFATMPRLKRQQQVLSCFADVLATGEVHALSVKTFTPEEWTASQQTVLAQIDL